MTPTWTWRKSSRSAAGQCVEIGTGTPLSAVRDSKLGDESPILTFTPDGITAFLDAAKAGKFDDHA